MKAVQQCTAFTFPAMYQVYVIKNEQNRLYIGLSKDVEKRLNDHNAGISTWTRYRGPWHLIWTSDPMNLKEARQLENFLKAQKGGDGLYRHIGILRSSRSSGS
jgi:putative endonuclease